MIKEKIDNKNIRIQRVLLSNFFFLNRTGFLDSNGKLIQFMLNINSEFFPEM